MKNPHFSMEVLLYDEGNIDKLSSYRFGRLTFAQRGVLTSDLKHRYPQTATRETCRAWLGSQNSRNTSCIHPHIFFGTLLHITRPGLCRWCACSVWNVSSWTRRTKGTLGGEVVASGSESDRGGSCRRSRPQRRRDEHKRS